MNRVKKRGDRRRATAPAGAAGWGRGGGHDRPKLSPEGAEATARAVRAYWERGRSSLAERPTAGGDFEPYAQGLGWAATRLRKARQFASPEAGGYTREQLAGLCRLIRRHRPLFGAAHVGALVTLPWGEGRAKLQRDCIEKNWSRSALLAAIAGRRGRGRADGGGRKPSVPGEPGLARARLRRMARGWERWCEAAEALGLLRELPRQLAAARDAVVKLREALDLPRAKAQTGAPAAPARLRGRPRRRPGHAPVG